jgi:hypothetical protein
MATVLLRSIVDLVVNWTLQPTNDCNFAIFQNIFAFESFHFQTKNCLLVPKSIRNRKSFSKKKSITKIDFPGAQKWNLFFFEFSSTKIVPLDPSTCAERENLHVAPPTALTVGPAPLNGRLLLH